MPPRRKLSTLNRGLAVGWHQKGISGREIARRLRLKNAVIQRLLEHFQATGSTDERPRPGRPRCTNQRQARFLHIAALRQRTTNTTRLRQELRRAANSNISQHTVRNHLHEFGLRSRVADVCLLLTPAHCQARRAWCRRQQCWTRQQWGRVYFTDESRFALTKQRCQRTCVVASRRAVCRCLCSPT